VVTPTVTPSVTPTPYANIYGFVNDAYGKPVESAEIELRKLKSTFGEESKSNKYGFFEFKDLKASKYLVKLKTNASKGFSRGYRKTTKLKEGETKIIKITVKMTSPEPSPTPIVTATSTSIPMPTPTPKPTQTPTPAITPVLTPTSDNKCRIFGFIKDSSGEPIASVSVYIRKLRTDNIEFTTTSDEYGFFEFDGLEAGKYRLKAEKDFYRIYKKVLDEIKEGETREVEIVM